MRSLLRRWLRHVDSSELDVMEVLTAAGEAAANAIEHAAAGRDATVEISGRAENGGITITVRDHGSWRARDTDPANRGRGLALMRALMDEVEVRPSPQGTTVEMRRLLNRDTDLLTAEGS